MPQPLPIFLFPLKTTVRRILLFPHEASRAGPRRPGETRSASACLKVHFISRLAAPSPRQPELSHLRAARARAGPQDQVSACVRSRYRRRAVCAALDKFMNDSPVPGASGSYSRMEISFFTS